jgi:PAS domain S-box-containing protein
MTWFDLISALPQRNWLPFAGSLLPVLLASVWMARSRRRGASVADTVASRVAVTLAVGLAGLVAVTSLSVLRSGLGSTSGAQVDALVRLAEEVGDLAARDPNDELRIRPRLQLGFAFERQWRWTVLEPTAPCDDDGFCRIVAGLPLDDAGLRRLTQAAARRDIAGPLPINGRGEFDVALRAPVRGRDGRPTALLFVGLDASDLSRQAATAGWAVLGIGLLLFGITTWGTQRMLGATVAERVRDLIRALEASSPTGSDPRAGMPTTSDELQTLAERVNEGVAQAVQREARISLLVEHAPIGIAELDGDGRVLEANPALARLLRWTSPRDCPAEPLTTAVFADARQAESFAAALADGRELDGAEYRWRRIDGTPCEVRLALVRLPRGEGRRSALLVEDTSEQRALDAQLQRAQKMEAIGRLTGGIAHDFNNLLTVIRANVVAMGHDVHGAELAAIDDAAVRGARLVRRLLAMSRTDTLELRDEPIDELLHEIIGMLRRVLPERILISAPADLPGVAVRADRVAVEQVLLNLALNARDAMPDGGTLAISADLVVKDAVTAARRGLPGPGRYVRLTIADTGEGMSDETLARAFEPFFTTKSAEAGSGLGLAVVYGIMKQHGGAVTVQSRVGQGTTFVLWFAVSDLPAAPAVPSAATGTAAPAAVGGARVLLVEDEEAVRRATERALRRIGYDVATADGAMAADALLEPGHAFAAVVSDVMMPGATGLDLLRNVRARGDRTPFLFVSGYSSESLEGVLGTDSAVSVLPKPWTVGELAARVRSAIDPDTAV